MTQQMPYLTELASAATSSSSTSQSSPRNSVSPAESAQDHSASSLDAQRIFFPLRLHDIVSDKATDDIIRWLPSGKAFIIADKKRFAAEILPQCFLQQCQFTSFTRKLTRWRFNRVPRGPLIGAYYHDLFVKGCRDMCYHMTCKSEATRSSSRCDVATSKKTSTRNENMNVSAVTHTSDSSSDESTPKLFNSNLNIPSVPALQLPQKSFQEAATPSPSLSLENGIKQLVQVDACIRMLQQARDTQLILQQAQEVQLAEERAEAARLSLLRQAHLDQFAPEARVLSALNLVQTKPDLLAALGSHLLQRQNAGKR